MIFECLIIKPYKGTSVPKQQEIVKSLGGGRREGYELVYDISAYTIEDVKKIEAALKGKVPYGKIP